MMKNLIPIFALFITISSINASESELNKWTQSAPKILRHIIQFRHGVKVTDAPKELKPYTPGKKLSIVSAIAWYNNHIIIFKEDGSEYKKITVDAKT